MIDSQNTIGKLGKPFLESSLLYTLRRQSTAKKNDPYIHSFLYSLRSLPDPPIGIGKEIFHIINIITLHSRFLINSDRLAGIFELFYALPQPTGRCN